MAKDVRKRLLLEQLSALIRGCFDNSGIDGMRPWNVGWKRGRIGMFQVDVDCMGYNESTD
jgi:hypothetical protein